jgi:type I restriction-modification system DNA methylase subunit
MKLFETIPFLNGGLFDSLDTKDNESRIIIDGFSREDKWQAKMPDFLFFETSELDFDEELRQIYGTTRERYEVKGLFEIFREYKFTIEENTPLETDVALDPYLLGEIFENLLAYYNPETGTTARKGSGSFYTPQEIVNYMVDESLKQKKASQN